MVSVTLVTQDCRLTIPGSVQDVESFLDWTEQLEFPEQGNIWWLRGGVWADLTREQMFTHNLIRLSITCALHNIVRQEDTGLLVDKGVYVTNVDARLSGTPDGVFISHESRLSGCVHLVDRRNNGQVTIMGSPDMVLEVISETSAEKDLDFLFEDYYTARIREYWRVDARRSPFDFRIFQRSHRKYRAVRKHAGWLKSSVFQKSFRMTEATDRFGHPKFTLEAR